MSLCIPNKVFECIINKHYILNSELGVVSEDKPESTPGTCQNMENPTYDYSMHILKSEI